MEKISGKSREKLKKASRKKKGKKFHAKPERKKRMSCLNFNKNFRKKGVKRVEKKFDKKGWRKKATKS